jgi:hypothetical protein
MGCCFVIDRRLWWICANSKRSRRQHPRLGVLTDPADEGHVDFPTFFELAIPSPLFYISLFVISRQDEKSGLLTVDVFLHGNLRRRKVYGSCSSISLVLTYITSFNVSSPSHLTCQHRIFGRILD